MKQTSGAIASPGLGLHAPIKFSSLDVDRGADATASDMTKIAEHPSERRKTASHASGPPPLQGLPNPTAHSTASLLMKARGFKPPTHASDPVSDFSNPAFDLFSPALPSKTDWRAFFGSALGRQATRDAGPTPTPMKPRNASPVTFTKRKNTRLGNPMPVLLQNPPTTFAHSLGSGGHFHQLLSDAENRTADSRSLQRL